MHRYQSVFVSVGLALGVFVAGASGQMLTANAQSQMFDLLDDFFRLDVDNRTGASSDGLVAGTWFSVAPPNVGGVTTARAAVGFGYFGGVARVQGYANVQGSVTSSAGGTFTDTVVINAPGMQGQMGTRTALLSFVTQSGVSGFDDGGSNVSAFASVTVQVSNASVSYGGDWTLQKAYSEFPIDVVELEFDFVYGTPFTVSGSMGLFAVISSDGGSAQGIAQAAFPGSFRWLGISDLAADETVDGSIDWSKAAPIIPAPSAVWLGACLALPLIRRRRSVTGA